MELIVSQVKGDATNFAFANLGANMQKWQLRGAVLILSLLGMGACQQQEVGQSVPSQTKALSPANSTPDGIAAQVAANFNMTGLKPTREEATYVVVAHATLLPDGTITGVTIDNDHPDDPLFQQIADSAKRALLITHRLVLPPGKTYEQVTFRFPVSNLVE